MEIFAFLGLCANRGNKSLLNTATLYQSKRCYCPNFCRGRKFILFQSFKSRYGVQPASDPVGNRGTVIFPAVKQPTREADRSPSASAVFEKD
jgi:hypothetical protein